MDRHLVAYLLIALLLIAVVVLAARARYYSRDQVSKRRRRADEARWAARLLPHEEGNGTAD
jgi:hypothetical protein